jgi:hypothetical protein
VFGVSGKIGGTYGWPWEVLGVWPDEPWRGFPRRPFAVTFALLAVLLITGLLVLNLSLLGYLFYLAATGQ